MPLRCCWTLVAATLLFASDAAALDIGSPEDLASVEAHAFVSQGFILTSQNQYLANETTKGSFQYTEVGVNLTKQVTDRFRIGLQLYASDLGPTGTFDARMDWFYLDYRFADWLGVRAGRVKIPFGLYNEVNDVDAARVPILLPQSVYPLENRNYLLAQTGGEIYGYLRLGGAGALEYRLYGGTILLDSSLFAGTPYQVVSYDVPYVVGGRLMWETPLDGLRLGGSLQALEIDADLALASQQTSVQIPAQLWVGSVEYAAHDLLLSAEYSRWYASDSSTNTALLPDTSTSISERAYAMASYRVRSWFQPGVYYSLYFPDTRYRSGRENIQSDGALTLRYDLNAHWLLKLEGHYLVGTAALSPSLNDNVPLSGLAQNWGAFLVKTTAYF